MQYSSNSQTTTPKKGYIGRYPEVSRCHFGTHSESVTHRDYCTASLAYNSAACLLTCLHTMQLAGRTKKRQIKTKKLAILNSMLLF